MANGVSPALTVRYFSGFWLGETTVMSARFTPMTASDTLSTASSAGSVTTDVATGVFVLLIASTALIDI